MVKSIGVPGHPFAFGVTVIVAVIGVNPVFVVVKLLIGPFPVAAKPIEGLSFVQSKVVPVTFPENEIGPLTTPLHLTRLAIGLIVGFGLTVMVNVLDKPGQLLAVGVTVIVAMMGVVPVFIAVNEEMLLVPDAAIPILVVLDDQEKFVAETFPVKLISVLISPAQSTTFGVVSTSGFGFTDTTTSKGKPAQPLDEGITV